MKKIMLLINVIALLLYLTSCSGAKPKEIVDPVEIRFPIFSSELPRDMMEPYDLMLLAAIDNFNELHPHIKVIAEYTPRLVEMDTTMFTLESAAPPDIVWFSSTLSYKKMIEAERKELLMDLRPLLHSQNLDIPDNILARGEVNNKMMILPYGAVPGAVFYNKNLFDAANVAYPQGEWTWDQFRQTARRLEASNSAILGAQLPYSIFGMEYLMTGVGKSVLSPDQTAFSGYLNSSDALNAFRWLRDGYMDEEERGLGDSAHFMNDTVGMTLGTTRFVEYMSADNPHIGVAPWPYADGGSRGNPMEIVGYGISSKSKHPIEAWEFIKYIAVSVNEDSIKLAGKYMPTNKALAEAVRKNANENMLVLMDEIDYAVQPVFEYINLPQMFTTEIFNQFKEIFEADDADVPELLKDLARQLDLNM